MTTWLPTFGEDADERDAKKIARSADTDYRERSRLQPACSATANNEDDTSRIYKEFDFCSANSSIHLRPFVFANGKADKTFNMFKLASIPIVPIR